MTQVDPAETGQGDGRRDTGSGTWRAGIRRAIRIGSRPEPWKRGPVLAALALLLALFMMLHAKIQEMPLGVNRAEAIAAAEEAALASRPTIELKGLLRS